MTTIVLQAAGAALGSYFGPLGEMLGRAAGAIAGNAIDQSLFGSPRKVTGPRLVEMAGLSASEGEPIPRLYGRARLGGQLIWATHFEEEMVTTVRKARGAKGGPSGKVRERSFTYFANLAVALCEGEISYVRRVWADGRELDLRPLTMRVHRGDRTQMPDPLILAKEGADQAPAYRGVAYVVFERLPLEAFGNRVPQFAFEVVRALPGLKDQVRSVNLIPGAGEFAYQPTRVDRVGDFGSSAQENANQLQADSDVVASLDQLQTLCPNLESVNLVVSWFGDDLRAGQCTIAPRVDQQAKATQGAEWSVAGLARAQARLVSLVDGRPSYGGTPSDAAVLALIAELKRRGLKVALYPFIMMDVPPENALPDPYGAARQAAYPWRGRIACMPAPGQPGSPDGTAAASTQVDAFAGTAVAADFTLQNGAVICAKPAEWSFRRHILHYARLAQAAGGVDAFIIGTEMIGLTRVRSASGVYPFVATLRSLATEVRTMLGPSVRLTYAADWTEYGAHVLAGGQEVRFPLDPLWAAPEIDAVGIDWYAPISDWRDGTSHLDAAEARSQQDPAYLRRRQRAGEAFDWYYADAAGRTAQQRLPITDGAIGKPWVFRQKDLAGWWSNAHRERVAGAELAQPTAWVPGSKPIWLTEIGCPAVDKGANAPNIFPDALSAEGGLPPFSSGARDDLMQQRALSAQIGAFDPSASTFDPLLNPLRPGHATRMLHPRDLSVWAWDARPFPAFPMLAGVWSDGANWRTGHWLNGRLENAPLDALFAAILADYGLSPAARIEVDALVDGYVLDRPMSARAALEPLARLFGVSAHFGAAGLALVDGVPGVRPTIPPERLAVGEDQGPFLRVRAQESELPRELRIGFVDGDWDYRRATSRSRRLGGQARRESALEAAIVMPKDQADRLAEARLRDAWIGRERLSFALSPREAAFEPGDAFAFAEAGGLADYRVEAVAHGDTIRIEAARVERAPAALAIAAPDRAIVRPPALAGPAFVRAIELPIAEGADATLIRLAIRSDPWAGPYQIERSADGAGFALQGEATRPALVARTLTTLAPGPLWRWDEQGAVEIEVASGLLQSVTDAAALAGINSFALEGPDGAWEIMSAASAVLIGPNRYRLSRLIRGLGGSEAMAARTLAPGALVIGLDEALVPVAAGGGDIARALSWRVSPAGATEGDPGVATLTATPTGAALRPLAPVHPRARRITTGVSFSWIRRARYGGDSWEVVEPPLGEERERYRVTLYDGAAIKRQVETEEPSWLYPAAQELADFGAPRLSFDLAIAQISAALGPGAERRSPVAIAIQSV